MQSPHHWSEQKWGLIEKVLYDKFSNCVKNMTRSAFYAFSTENLSHFKGDSIVIISHDSHERRQVVVVAADINLEVEKPDPEFMNRKAFVQHFVVDIKKIKKNLNVRLHICRMSHE